MFKLTGCFSCNDASACQSCFSQYICPFSFSDKFVLCWLFMHSFLPCSTGVDRGVFSLSLSLSLSFSLLLHDQQQHDRNPCHYNISNLAKDNTILLGFLPLLLFRVVDLNILYLSQSVGQSLRVNRQLQSNSKAVRHPCNTTPPTNSQSNKKCLSSTRAKPV